MTGYTTVGYCPLLGNCSFISVRCVLSTGVQLAIQISFKSIKTIDVTIAKLLTKCAQILVNALLFYRRSLNRMKWFTVVIRTGLTVKSQKFYIRMTRKRYADLVRNWVPNVTFLTTFQSIIVSKPFGITGAESGANESNVSIGITWTDGESLIESYDSTTLTRYTLKNALIFD